ncbi:MAG: helix-turn-helix domain-containing protein [Xanthobacteraceae bacterium]|jgi:excisionase family DNA binding protein
MAKASRLYPIFLSTSELAAAVGVSRRVVYQWVRQGLPVYQLGVKKKILVADAVEFFRANLKRADLKGVPNA